MKIIQQNKKAYFHFEILEKSEAGIILKGTEISVLVVIGAIIVAYLGLFFLYEKFFVR